MKISRRKLQSIEANAATVSVDEKEELILCNRYGSFLKLFDQLSDRDKEDVVWVIKQRINGAL